VDACETVEDVYGDRMDVSLVDDLSEPVLATPATGEERCSCISLV
jgi:hypothetical protein